MARLFTTGFEGKDATLDGLTGSVGYSTTAVRTGTYALQASGAISVSFTGATGRDLYFRSYCIFSNAPVANTQIISFPGFLYLLLKTDGTLQMAGSDGSTLIGTASNVIDTNFSVWYRLELHVQINTGSNDDTAEFAIDGAIISSTTTANLGTTAPGTIQFLEGTNSTTVRFDDAALNDSTGSSQTSWPGAGRIVLLLPVTDNATGTGWNLGTNTAPGGAGHTALANIPPLGVADLAAGSDPKQMRNATSNANVNVDMNMTTYSAAGIAAVDTVNVIDPIVATGAPVVTSAKAGTVGVVSNPTIANVSLGAGGTAGAFWSGVAAGTYPTGWKISHGTVTYGSAVTVGTAPVMRITQVTASTRIAMVCFMGMYVDYTPGILPYVNPMPPMIAQ